MPLLSIPGECFILARGQRLRHCVQYYRMAIRLCKVQRESFRSASPVPAESPAFFADSWFVPFGSASPSRGSREKEHQLTEAYTTAHRFPGGNEILGNIPNLSENTRR